MKGMANTSLFFEFIDEYKNKCQLIKVLKIQNTLMQYCIKSQQFYKMEILQTPDKYKPLPKAHLFLHKLRRINSIDRQIRLKWQKLQQKKSQQCQNQFQNISELQRMRAVAEVQFVQNSDRNTQIPNRIAKIRSDIIRQQAHLRKKKYQEVYFKKNRRNYQPQIHFQLQKIDVSKSKQTESKLRRKSEGNQDNNPIMLQKRKVAMQRQLSGINNRYEAGVKAVSQKKNFLELKMWQSQKDMLKKIQGTKFYYRLATSWEPPN